MYPTQLIWMLLDTGEYDTRIKSTSKEINKMGAILKIWITVTQRLYDKRVYMAWDFST